jgi:hypothetical protein
MPDHKTTNYCAKCGESPDSAIHVRSNEHSHAYTPPECKLSWIGAASATTAMPPKAFDAVARVKVEDRPGMPQFGVFLGLLLDERGDTLTVIRLDHFGLMLKAVHPSKVTPVTPEEEETYK